MTDTTTEETAKAAATLEADAMHRAGQITLTQAKARVRAALAQQPAAPDRWNEGFKHGQWLAKHSAPVVERANAATLVQCATRPASVKRSV